MTELAGVPVEVPADQVRDVAERVARRSRRVAGTLLGLALVAAAYCAMMLLRVGPHASSVPDLSLVAGRVGCTLALVALAVPSMRRARRAETARQLAALDAGRFFVSEKRLSATRDDLPYPEASFSIDRTTSRQLLAIPRAAVVK